MKLELSKAEKDLLRKLNKFSYYLEINENRGEGEIPQEENLTNLIKSIKSFMSVMNKKRNIYIDDTLEEITEKTIKFLNNNTFSK